MWWRKVCAKFSHWQLSTPPSRNAAFTVYSGFVTKAQKTCTVVSMWLGSMPYHCGLEFSGRLLCSSASGCSPPPSQPNSPDLPAGQLYRPQAAHVSYTQVALVRRIGGPSSIFREAYVFTQAYMSICEILPCTILHRLKLPMNSQKISLYHLAPGSNPRQGVSLQCCPFAASYYVSSCNLSFGGTVGGTNWLPRDADCTVLLQN